MATLSSLRGTFRLPIVRVKNSLPLKREEWCGADGLLRAGLFAFAEVSLHLDSSLGWFETALFLFGGALMIQTMVPHFGRVSFNRLETFNTIGPFF